MGNGINSTIDMSDNSSEIDSSIQNVPEDVLAGLLGGTDTGGVQDRDLSDRYSYNETIGEGGQGVVISAKDELLERVVAIKALKVTHNPAHEKMLEQEAKLCGRLEHPNIIPTYDLARDEADSPLFVMKKIEGQTLNEFLLEIKHEGGDSLQNNRLRLLNIFSQVLHAIDFAHSKGVLHLDIKPGNISLGEFGEVYVIDWGFARAKDTLEVSTLSGGTMHYMSPERMEKAPYDERADIYALGTMLYRLLTGKHPRDVGKMKLSEFKKNYMRIPIIPPRNRDRSIAPQLEAIVLKAMAEKPEDRYRYAHEFTNDLERFLQMLPVSAYEEGILSRSWRRIRKHKRKIFLLVILFALFAVTGYALSSKIRAEKERELAAAQQAAFKKAEIERRASMRRRYEARRILKRANDILEKNREAVEAATDQKVKKDILAPVLELYSNTIKTDPTYAEAYDKRASVYRLTQEFSKAIADYNKAFELDSSYIMALYEAGMIYADVLHDTQKAREKFRQMASLFPEDEYAELGQARVDLIEAGAILKLTPDSENYANRYELASAIYSNTLKRCEVIEETNPALTDIWYLRGLIYQKSPEHKNLELALEVYSKYLLSRRDSSSAFLNRGDTYKDLEKYTEAISDYTEALKLNPNFIWALRNRGYILYRYMDMPEAAIRDLNKAIELDPEAAWSYMSRGAVYIGIKNYEAAKADYEAAMLLAPNDVNIIYNNGVLAMYMGNPHQAELYFTKAIAHATNKELANIELKRGMALFAQEKYADAIRDFESAISRNQIDNNTAAFMRVLALKLAGLPFDANQLGSSIIVPDDKIWISALASFFLGEAEELDVLNLAGDPFAKLIVDEEIRYSGSDKHKEILLGASDLATVCQVRFYLGMYNLAVGNNAAAKRDLQACIDTDEHLYIEHALAKLFIKSVE